MAKNYLYNNLVDVDAAIHLVNEFEGETAFVIIKHTNACGVATGGTVKEAYLKAFQADTLSAFGGVLATNQVIDMAAAEEINKLFFEILIAPATLQTHWNSSRPRKTGSFWYKKGSAGK